MRLRRTVGYDGLLSLRRQPPEKNGLTNNGQQRYQCHACGRSLRDGRTQNGYSAERREEILRAYHERTSLRGLTRIFGVSRQTVTSWLKKSR